MTDPYPQKGVGLRDFLKAYKSGDDSAVKVGHKPGLYYFAGDLPPRYKRGDNAGFDAQIKIGAAGLKAPKKDFDYKLGGQSMPRSKIAGRLQMYAGHQGVANPRLLGARAMTPGKTVKGKSSNVEQSEDAMKEVMQQMAKPETKGGHPGVKAATDAYTGEMDDDGQFQYRKGVTPEWYIVDWDEVDSDGYTPHQGIVSAMGEHPIEAPSHAEQYLVSARKNKYPKLSFVSDPHTIRDRSSTRSSGARQAQKLNLKAELQRKIQEVRDLEMNLWYSRHAAD